MAQTKFQIDSRDMKQLKKFMKKSPKDFQRASSNVLTSLAFQTRTNDIKNLHRGLIIRDERFLRSSLRVQKAKNTNINNQFALAYSIERPRFTGWKEQQTGVPSKHKRKATSAARGGNTHKKMRSQARLKTSNKIYKPDQFQGRTFNSKFQFMMRVLGSRGGGRFILSEKYKSMGKGLYELTKGKKIKRLQDFTAPPMKPKRYQWRSMSLRQLNHNNNIRKTWQKSIDYVVKKYR